MQSCHVVFQGQTRANLLACGLFSQATNTSNRSQVCMADLATERERHLTTGKARGKD